MRAGGEERLEVVAIVVEDVFEASMSATRVVGDRVVVDVLRDEDDGGGGVHEGGVQLRGRVGLTAHPRRLRASPVSHVTMNARDMPSDLPLRKLAYIWGSSAEPQARMEARPSAKERRSRTPHAQSPNHVWVQRQPQSAGHSTRGETMAEKRTREEGARARVADRARKRD